MLYIKLNIQHKRQRSETKIALGRPCLQYSRMDRKNWALRQLVEIAKGEIKMAEHRQEKPKEWREVIA